MGDRRHGGGPSIASAAIHAPRLTLAVVALAAVLAAVFGLKTPSLLGRASNDFVAQGSESTRAEAGLERASGLSASPQLLVLVRRPTPQRVARVVTIIRSEPVFPVVAPPLYRRDRTAAIVAAYARAGGSQ